ncbi:MAG TPA: dihydropteroate synthase [Brumimicrobium sp.]|nr:dihydropteroate synthase [Brumimicrobium sp.]
MEVKDNKYDLINWIKCQDKLHNLESPLIMGVLNVTPDSFFTASRKASFEEAMTMVHKMVKADVDIIDVGGVSTRPNADLLSKEEETRRVLPVIEAIRKLYPNVLVSIDTFRADVARQAVSVGAHIINDVYGGSYDENMFDTVAELDVPYILMHSRGTAADMQSLCNYKDVVMDVCKELSQSVQKLRSKGVKDIIIDPGFGFAKDLKQNYELFEGMKYLKSLDCPLLIGISRKSMIYNLLKTSSDESLIGTTVLNTVAVGRNASIVRVHDVKEAIEVRKLMTALKN